MILAYEYPRIKQTIRVAIEKQSNDLNTKDDSHHLPTKWKSLLHNLQHITRQIIFTESLNQSIALDSEEL